MPPNRSHSRAGKGAASPRTFAPRANTSPAPIGISKAASITPRTASRRAYHSARSAPTHPAAKAKGVNRVVALFARSRRRYSARAVNMR